MNLIQILFHPIWILPLIENPNITDFAPNLVSILFFLFNFKTWVEDLEDNYRGYNFFPPLRRQDGMIIDFRQGCLSLIARSIIAYSR